MEEARKCGNTYPRDSINPHIRCALYHKKGVSWNLLYKLPIVTQNNFREDRCYNLGDLYKQDHHLIGWYQSMCINSERELKPASLCKFLNVKNHWEILKSFYTSYPQYVPPSPKSNRRYDYPYDDYDALRFMSQFNISQFKVNMSEYIRTHRGHMAEM